MIIDHHDDYFAVEEQMMAKKLREKVFAGYIIPLIYPQESMKSNYQNITKIISKHNFILALSKIFVFLKRFWRKLKYIYPNQSGQLDVSPQLLQHNIWHKRLDQKITGRCIHDVTTALGRIVCPKWIIFPRTMQARQAIKFQFYNKFGLQVIIMDALTELMSQPTRK